MAFYVIAESFILASALSLDAFVASFAYGSNKIKIPLLSVLVINVVCSAILGISLAAGTALRQFIPDWLTPLICFSILFALGITKLLDSVTKAFIRKHTDLHSEFKFSLFNIKFILRLYADPEKADIDSSRVISPPEAASLALALSLDGIAVGFGAAMGNVNCLAVFLWSLITDALMVVLGCMIGNKTANKIPFNLSWLSGIILMILAATKLL